MINFFKKAWNSPTWSTLLRQITIPLKFLLLTPLVLTRFSALELDVFFLIASTTILFTIFQNRLTSVFARMLCFAFGGATELGKWTTDKSPSLGQPNWKLFKEAYLALGTLLFICFVPALLLSVGLMWLSVATLLDFSYQDKVLWAGALLGAASPAVSFLLMRPNLALRATGKIPLQNRISTLVSIASIVTGALVVILGGRLISILCVQLFFTTLERYIMIWYLPSEIRPYATKGKWSKRVFNWAREPLWKGLVAVLAGMGTHRSVGVFLASTGTVGYAAPFLFVQSLLTTCQGIASAPLTSQLPRYSKMLEEGKREAIAGDSLFRITFTTLFMITATLGISFVIPVMLPLLKANMKALPVLDSLALGGLRCIYWPLICFNLVQGVSNDVKVVWRLVVAIPFSILLFFIGLNTQQYLWFALGMYLPLIMVLNWYTWNNYLEFLGKTSSELLISLKLSFRRRLSSIF